jgi:hypothetical protein
VDASVRRLGQLLVAMAALLGAALGVTLALIVENTETSRADVALGRERAAVLAASPPSSQPPATRAASSADSADGSGSSADQRVGSAGRTDQRDGKAGKDGESRRAKAGDRSKDKPSKEASKGNDK